MDLRDIDKKIISMIDEESLPQSLKEISQRTGYAQATIASSLKKLEEQGYIIKVGSNKTRQYYIPVKALRKIKPEDLENWSKELNNITADVKGSYEDIEEKTEALERRMVEFEGKMNQFYVNIISIMAVFVAIFALININIKIVADVATTISWGAVGTCAIIDVSAVILIWMMLFILKRIIINPLRNGGDSNGGK